MLEAEKEIQTQEFGYSALIVQVKQFWLKTDQPKKPDLLSSFKLSYRNVDLDVENKDTGEHSFPTNFFS